MASVSVISSDLDAGSANSGEVSGVVSNSTDYVDVDATTTGFTTLGALLPNTKYLILANAQVGGEHTGTLFGYRLVFEYQTLLTGNVELTGSEMLKDMISAHVYTPPKSGKTTPYTYCNIVTTGNDTVLDLKFQQKTGNASYEVRTEYFSIVAIDLTNLYEGTDYWYEESAAQDTHTITPTPRVSRRHYFHPPNTEQNWLVMSHTQTDVNDVSQQWGRVELRETRNDGTNTSEELIVALDQFEGENDSEIVPSTLMGVFDYTPHAAGGGWVDWSVSTFDTQPNPVYNPTPFAASFNSHRFSTMIGLRLDSFENFSKDSDSSSLSVDSTWTNFLDAVTFNSDNDCTAIVLGAAASHFGYGIQASTATITVLDYSRLTEDSAVALIEYNVDTGTAYDRDTAVVIYAREAQVTGGQYFFIGTTNSECAYNLNTAINLNTQITANVIGNVITLTQGAKGQYGNTPILLANVDGGMSKVDFGGCGNQGCAGKDSGSGRSGHVSYIFDGGAFGSNNYVPNESLKDGHNVLMQDQRDEVANFCPVAVESVVADTDYTIKWRGKDYYTPLNSGGLTPYWLRRSLVVISNNIKVRPPPVIYSSETSEVYASGSDMSEVFIAGTDMSQVFIAGAEETQVNG